MGRVITQRELRNESGRIMRALDKGKSFIATRNGVPVGALLALKRIDSSRHSGVIALFREHYVKPGLVPADVARALPQAFARRQRADYGDFAEAQEGDVQTLRGDVERFLDRCVEIVTREPTT